MKNWSFEKGARITEKWPKRADGEFYAPVFLAHISGGPLDTELTLNLLEAYGIPSVCEYPNDGTFGKIILGRAAAGMDVFVPENMIEDARNLISGDVEIIEEEMD